MARLAHEGHEVYVVVVTKADSSMFAPDSVERVRQEAVSANQVLGAMTIFLEGFPAALMDTIPHAQLNDALRKVLEEIKSEFIFTPFCGDRHLDHQIIFNSVMVAARPNAGFNVRAIYAYETLSETNWYAPPLTPGFMPNKYVYISDFLDKKLQAMSTYQSQVQSFPHEHSLESIRALAELRGTAMGFRAAEAFVLIRSIHPTSDGCNLD